MFDWPELLVLAIQSLRLLVRKIQSNSWTVASGTVQSFSVQRGFGFWAPNQYRSVLGYVFRANESRYAGFFAIEANDEETAKVLQRQAEGTKVTVRFNPRNPDISLIQDQRICGRKVTQNPHWL